MARERFHSVLTGERISRFVGLLVCTLLLPEAVKKFNGRDALPRVHNRKPKPDAGHRVPTGSGSCGKRNFFTAFRGAGNELPASYYRLMDFKIRAVQDHLASEKITDLQLVLKNGETLVTEAGQKVLLKEEAIDLGPESIGGWIRHRGWTLKLHSKGRLTWPVFPYNPYANAPVKRIEGAVGLLSIPITAQRQPKAGESDEEGQRADHFVGAGLAPKR